LSALPAVAAPELSPPRAELQRAIAAVGEAQAKFEKADRPVQALQKVIADADKARAEHAALRADRQRRISKWLIEGQQGERPAAEEEARVEHMVRLARAEAEAAELALVDFSGGDALDTGLPPVHSWRAFLSRQRFVGRIARRQGSIRLHIAGMGLSYIAFINQRQQQLI
jgi:hypothetical protein